MTGLDITISKEEANTLLNDVIAAKLTHGEVTDLIIARAKRRVDEERAEVMKRLNMDGDELPLPQETLKALIKKHWADAKAECAASSLHYAEADKSFELTLKVKLTPSEMPAEYIEKRAEYRKTLKEKNRLDEALRNLTDSRLRRELRTAILESVLRLSKKGQQLSALVDEMVKTARQHLLKA